jgi:hypothetical protein
LTWKAHDLSFSAPHLLPFPAVCCYLHIIYTTPQRRTKSWCQHWSNIYGSSTRRTCQAAATCFSKATEEGPTRTTTATTAVGCQLSLSRVLHSGAALRRALQEAHRKITCDRHALAYKPLWRPLLLEHAYAYHRGRHKSRTPDRTHHPRPIIISRFEVRPVPWNRHGDSSMRSRSSELEGGYTNGIHGPGFSIACNFGFLVRLYNGLRITRKVSAEEGRDEFALAHYLFISRTRRPSRLTGRGCLGMTMRKGRKTV